MTQLTYNFLWLYENLSQMLKYNILKFCFIWGSRSLFLLYNSWVRQEKFHSWVATSPQLLTPRSCLHETVNSDILKLSSSLLRQRNGALLSVDCVSDSFWTKMRFATKREKRRYEVHPLKEERLRHSNCHNFYQQFKNYAAGSKNFAAENSRYQCRLQIITHISNKYY